MTNLFLVPAGNPRARENFDLTVRRRVPLSALERLSHPALKLARSGRSGVSAWGTKPGKREINVSTWRAMERGDWVLFYFDGLFPVCGRVLVRERSPAVAKRLWGEDEGETWEYMYLLDEVRQVDIPRLALIERLGHEPGSFPRGFTRIDQDLDARFGSVGQLLDESAGVGHQLRLAVDAARAGNRMEAMAALDRLQSKASEQELRKAIEACVSSDPPRERKQITSRLVRDWKLPKKLKKLYGGRCQYCDFTFEKKDGQRYSEAAHIKPISLREADLDVKDNLLVLCPNHHKMLDHGALRIEVDRDGGRLLGVVGTDAKPLVNKHIEISGKP